MSEIFYIQSYDLQANIGGAYNRHIKHLPDDCWIVISDHDSNFLIPDFGKQLHDIIEKHGDEYGLFGCVTNRLRGLHQLYKNEFSNDFDVKNHFKIACELWEKNYSDVEETTGIAGVMMMFKKITWETVGGFKENDIACDTAFNKSIKSIGGKVGLMKGVYLFHCYRMWQNNHMLAANDTQHLRRK